MKKFLLLILVLLSSGALQAAQPDRFLKKLLLPSGQTAVVEEGVWEACSIGSFSARLYDAAPIRDATTFFSSGLIRARDGAIENVVPADIDGDQRPEIIVNVRSAGTGGYLSSHAFSVDQATLTLRAAVEGLPPDANPIAALQKAVETLR